MKHANKGIALITTLAILAVMAIMLLGVAFTTQIELWVTRNDTTSTMAHYVAQAGLQKYKAALFQNYRWVEAEASQEDPDRRVCLNNLSRGIDWERDGSLLAFGANNRIVMNPEAVFDANGTQVGSFQVTIFRDPNINHRYTIQSVGDSARARSTVTASFQISNGGILDSGIFLGDGASNRFINGRMTIRSGIHIVGNVNRPDDFVFVSNGDFSQLNHYNMNDYGLDAANRVTSANRGADNLCATLRVQHGRINVGGSTQLGEPSNQLIGVFVGDGPEDVVVTGNMTCRRNQGICTDQFDAFDLGIDAPTFPRFDDTAPNPDLCINPESNTTWRQCLHAEARTPGLGLRAKHGATIDDPEAMGFDPGLDPACETALESRDLTLSNQVLDCTYIDGNGRRGGFLYDGSTTTATLEVYGTVSLRGYNLTFTKATNYLARTNEYDYTDNAFTGNVVNNAAIVVEKLDPSSTTTGKVDFDGNLLPLGNDDANRFPNHVLAVLAEGDMYQRGSHVMAPLYTEGMFRIVQRNVLFGSIMANELCTTSAGNETMCNAGQRSEIVHINTGSNKPNALQMIHEGLPTFRILSYERR